jgi:hypothetical protein
MIPGISTAMEARLVAALDPAATDIREDTLSDREFTLLDADDPEALALGIHFTGGPRLTVAVTDRTRKLGRIEVQTGGAGNTLFFDNLRWEGNFFANFRLLGSDSVLVFNDIGGAYVSMPDLFFRSSQQFLFWGTGASAVGCNMEIEGEGRGVVVGDDALISSGVWIRNYDMHSMHDLDTGALISRPPVDTVIERHVWLGQDAMLLSCTRVGMGAIIGARAFVKGRVPPRVIAAGTPARVLREGISWGRGTYGMTAAERVSIGLPELP